MHFKFIADNGLSTIEKTTKLYLTLRKNHMTEKHKLEPAII